MAGGHNIASFLPRILFFSPFHGSPGLNMEHQNPWSSAKQLDWLRAPSLEPGTTTSRALRSAGGPVRMPAVSAYGHKATAMTFSEFQIWTWNAIYTLSYDSEENPRYIFSSRTGAHTGLCLPRTSRTLLVSRTKMSSSRIWVGTVTAVGQYHRFFM